ncbi:hypothetical protein E3N88_33314 [Mikania micrantha]|uniref:U-box domain-containing protein n=1 Tax=Mikania micrantha TaxID=192012 RepID=A0A5N6MBM6_9ASTR|nr:hypothetical protein E3N88_33314 [Mikania micrantha]
MYIFTGTELEEAGPEAQVYHEVRSAITALHHLLKGEGYHAAEPHLLEAGARMNQGHHLQEGTACQGQGQGHHPEAHLLRKGLCLMEIVLLILTKNTISECVSQLQSDCGYEVKQKALETLISITKASPQNRNLVLQNNEAIPTILNLLKSSPTLEKLSLSTIFNLSLNPNLKSTLAEMATIQHLNTTILSRGSLESARLAASLICSLAMLDKNKAVFGVANTIQVLLMAVSRSKGHATCTSPTKLTCRADLSGTALVILGLLARFDEGIQALINTPCIVSKMVHVLKERCMMSEGATEILIRVIDESEECLIEAMGLPDLMFVLAEVSVRGSTRAREKASILLKKLEANESYEEGNLAFLKW